MPASVEQFGIPATALRERVERVERRELRWPLGPQRGVEISTCRLFAPPPRVAPGIASASAVSRALEDSEYVDFSPTDEFNHVIHHLKGE